jgi:flagellar basal body rod protein FlgG
MMRSLWTAASGMTGQQFNIDTISNNLANVNTTGFKQMRPDFEDLLYQLSYLGAGRSIHKSPHYGNRDQRPERELRLSRNPAAFR